MTENQIQVAMKKIIPNVPSSMPLHEQLENADESCMDELMSMRFKSRTTSILLSLFLGNFGAGWFYVGDIGLGFGQLAMAMIANVFIALCTILMPALGIIICDTILFVLAFVWHLGNIFWALNKAKDLNYKKVCDFLYNHRSNTEKVA